MEWFEELDAVRGSNGWGPNPITYSEIEAWARLTQTELHPEEVMILKAMDRVALSKPEKRI